MKKLCFYDCRTTYLGIKVGEVLHLIDDYMACHQVISVTTVLVEYLYS